jgi:hypothetical protein
LGSHSEKISCHVFLVIDEKLSSLEEGVVKTANKASGIV